MNAGSPGPSRVATRWLQAIDFKSPGALKKYLEEHPRADRSKHKVVKEKPKEEEIELSDEDIQVEEEKPSKQPKKAPPPLPPKKNPSHKPEDGGHGKGDHGKEDHHEEHKEDKPPKKSWKEALTGLSSKAKDFFKEAPKSVKKFAEDDAFRRQTLMKAHGSLVNAPEKATKQLIHTFKEEVHEYKEAAGAVKLLASGKKLNGHQKKALKTAAFHVGLTVAATALTTTGLGAGATMFAKSMARHVALKAVGNMFEKAHILDELGHVGHGVKHIIDKLAAKKDQGQGESSEADNDRLLLDFIRALVAKELEGMDAEDVAEAMERASRKNDVHEASVKNLAYRYAAMTDKEGLVWVTNEILQQKIDGQSLEDHINAFLKQLVIDGQDIHDKFQLAYQKANGVEGWDDLTHRMMILAVAKHVYSKFGDDALGKLLPYLIVKGDFVS